MLLPHTGQNVTEKVPLNRISGRLVTGDVCQSASQIGLIRFIFVVIIVTMRSKRLLSELDRQLSIIKLQFLTKLNSTHMTIEADCNAFYCSIPGSHKAPSRAVFKGRVPTAAAKTGRQHDKRQRTRPMNTVVCVQSFVVMKRQRLNRNCGMVVVVVLVLLR